MAEFEYQGVDRSGKKHVGILEANGEGSVRMTLREKGIRPTRITKRGNALKPSLRGGKGITLPLEGLLVLTRQLHVLLTSGIPLVQALDVLSDQSSSKDMKTITSQLRDKVSEGAFLWQTLAEYPKAFPRMYVALVRAGESSGAIDTMLKRLGQYLEDTDRMRKMIKSAMMYPVVVCLLGVAIVAGMLIFVVPKFEEMLQSSGQALPAPTQFLIDASKFLMNNLWTVGGATALIIYIFINFIKSNEGRSFFQKFLFNVPIFGPLMQKSGIARFSRTLSTLLSSGVNLLDAIDICKNTIDNSVLEAATNKIRHEIEAGKTLGMVLSKINVFPKMATQMILIGESTGNLDSMLDRVAEFYENEVDTMVAGMSKLIEPLVLVVLGAMVGGILIAMYLPVFQMAGAAGS